MQKWMNKKFIIWMVLGSFIYDLRLDTDLSIELLFVKGGIIIIQNKPLELMEWRLVGCQINS